MKLLSFTMLFALLFSEYVIVSFNKNSNANNWFIINDSVMGGISTSDVEVNQEGNLCFFGKVSTQNNGGFAMVRSAVNVKLVTNYKQICLRVKGDGKKYQLRLKSKANQGFWYVNSFVTNGKWQTIKLNIKDFEAQFRGRSLNLDNFNSDTIEEIGILIGNKKEEHFKLEIDNLKLK